VAVTHNFVSATGLPSALAFLGTRSAELVSGCDRGAREGLHARFLAALRQQRPEVSFPHQIHPKYPCKVRCAASR
jgi:hypothetical protein